MSMQLITKKNFCNLSSLTKKNSWDFLRTRKLLEGDRCLCCTTTTTHPVIPPQKWKTFWNQVRSELDPILHIHPIWLLHFWVFPRLKEDLAGTSFERPQDLGRAINQRLKSYGEEWYAACYVKWCERLQKCIEQQGDYVEGLRQWFIFFLFKYTCSLHSKNCIILLCQSSRPPGHSTVCWKQHK